MKKIFDKYKEVIMYLIFGVLTTLFSIAIYWLLTITFLNPNSPIQLQIANILSWIGGVLFAYFTNRKYVFESKNKNKFNEFSSFVGARIITLLFDMVFMFVFVTVFHLNDKIIKLISTFVVIASNYIFSKLFVFKEKQENSNEEVSTSSKVINYIFWGLGIIIVLFYLFMFFYKQPLVNEEVLPDVTNNLIPWEVKQGESFIKAILTRPFDLKITEYGQYRPRYLAFLVQFLDENIFLSIVRAFPSWGNRLFFYIIAMFLTVFTTYYFIRSFYKKLPKGVSFFVASTIIMFQNYQVTTYWRARSAKLLAVPACIFLLTYALKNLDIKFEKKNWKKIFLAIPIFVLMTLDEQVLALVAMILAFATLISIINKKVNIISPMYLISCILYASFHLWWGKTLFIKYTGSYTPHGHTIDGAVSGINLLSIWQAIQILYTTIGKIAFLSFWIFIIVFIYSLFRFCKSKISKEKVITGLTALFIMGSSIALLMLMIDAHHPIYNLPVLWKSVYPLVSTIILFLSLIYILGNTDYLHNNLKAILLIVGVFVSLVLNISNIENYYGAYISQAEGFRETYTDLIITQDDIYTQEVIATEMDYDTNSIRSFLNTPFTTSDFKTTKILTDLNDGYINNEFDCYLKVESTRKLKIKLDTQDYKKVDKIIVLVNDLERDIINIDKESIEHETTIKTEVYRPCKISLKVVNKDGSTSSHDVKLEELYMQ